MEGGYRVPDGFIILFPAFVNDEPTSEAWREILGGIRDLRRRHSNCSFAVRSSAVCEDSAQAAFAGQFDSVLDVGTDDEIRGAIITVRCSRHLDRVKAYDRAKGLENANHEVAVVIQCFVRASMGGSSSQ